MASKNPTPVSVLMFGLLLGAAAGAGVNGLRAFYFVVPHMANIPAASTWFREFNGISHKADELMVVLSAICFGAIIGSIFGVLTSKFLWRGRMSRT